MDADYKFVINSEIALGQCLLYLRTLVLDRYVETEYLAQPDDKATFSKRVRLSEQIMKKGHRGGMLIYSSRQTATADR